MGVLSTVILTLAALGWVSGASVLCTDYAAGGGGDGPEGYYVRPIPSRCRSAALKNWRPTFRIKEPWSECKEGYRKYKTSCYKLARGNANISFKDAEEECNRRQGHIFVPKDREEFMWVHNNIANQNKWYFVGIFCGNGGLDIRQTYVVTGEDMRKIGGSWGFRGHQALKPGSHPCYMWHRNNPTWTRQFHYSTCLVKQGGICESPLE